jgi:oligopeptide transport system ATP-binding protein
MTAPVTPLLEVEDVSVSFTLGGGLFERRQVLHAVTGVSLEVAPGETLGIVGESGCGKSTLARAIIGLQRISAGTIRFDGRTVASARRQTASLDERLAFARNAQIVFQDPLGALNPRMRIGHSLAEPLLTHEPRMPRSERNRQIAEMLERVGLSPEMANRFPHEFSGGQAQRIGIARALMLRPKMLVCDEPVASLDVSIQAQIINLLRELQRDLGLAIIFISHDLSIVRHIAHRVMVLYLGRMMEFGENASLFSSSAHPYTRALISAVLRPDPTTERRRARILLNDELPSPVDPPSGCVFRTRCPIAQARCASEEPKLVDVSGSDGRSGIAAAHHVACHFPDMARRLKGA